MLQLIKRLDPEKYSPCQFVLANTDRTSEEKIKTCDIPVVRRQSTQWFTIQRSREVRQSYVTTVFTSLKALLESIVLIARQQPELLICNGPGTCVPLCYALFLLRMVGINTHSRIVFVESFCRVHTLSLTGKLLYYISDHFVVQWPALAEKYARAEYLGVIC